ncbi:hypothetical protein DUT91_06605 [Phyllobacterium salinisoli]|uniref:Uncharacterized protein n=2 Tax=Phyllobacterium salinisoli TaxID=1899321 RepID=A0A368K795_9HYPH|nr:hypothetical protein DUT91_06605 [Phyllobacterium salinisoli]
MKTFALTIAALAFSAGAAFAENPNFGIPADLQDPTQPIASSGAQPVMNHADHFGAIDYTATSDIGETGVSQHRMGNYVSDPMDNPAAHRFTDASPNLEDQNGF